MGILREDFNISLNEIETGINATMPILKDIMVDALKNTINSEVYAKYSPKQYLRRSENPSLGTPLIDIEANSDITITNNEIVINYEPTGEHDNLNWWSRDGDDLINWISTSHDGIPARPFMDEYSNLMLQGNGLEDGFVAAYKAVNPDDEIIADGGIIGTIQS